MSAAPEAASRLASFDSPTLSNAIEAFGLRDHAEGFTGGSLRRIVGTGPIVGRAVTATIGSRSPGSDAEARTALYELARATAGPTILVLVDIDEEPACGAFLGEMQATLFSRLGAVGIATNGSVRDLDQLRSLGFTTYADAVTVSHAWAHLVEVACPVELAGMAVRTGDLLHGDEHGLVVVPDEVVEQLPAVASAIVVAERAMCAWIASDAFEVGGILERFAGVREAARKAAAR